MLQREVCNVEFPAFVKFRDDEIRRCSVCKNKNKWREHLKGNHKFDIPEQKDDQYMINITKNRIRIGENRMQDNIVRDKIKNLTAKLAGTLDISASKTSAIIFKNYIVNLLECGIQISKAYGEHTPNLSNFAYHLTDKVIAYTMHTLASKEKQKRLSNYKEKFIANVAADAGLVLGYKCVHGVLIHPGLDDVIPIDVYENHGYTAEDYRKFFTDIFQQVFDSRIYIAGVIVDQLPAQMVGLHKLIDESENLLISSIIIIPCFCHLINLILTSATRHSELIRTMSLIFKRSLHN